VEDEAQRQKPKDAVHLITTGKSREATAAFRSALGLLKIEPPLAGSSSSAPKGSCKHLGNPWGSTLYKSHIAIPGLKQESSLCFAYNHGILIIDDAVQQVLCEETKSRYSSIVLFNWAMVFYREGMTRNSQYLKKASIVYSSCLHAIRIAVSFRSEEASSDSSDDDLLALLVLNNLVRFTMRIVHTPIHPAALLRCPKCSRPSLNVMRIVPKRFVSMMLRKST
jgi:hypothetical protein